MSPATLALVRQPVLELGPVNASLGRPNEPIEIAALDALMPTYRQVLERLPPPT